MQVVVPNLREAEVQAYLVEVFRRPGLRERTNPTCFVTFLAGSSAFLCPFGIEVRHQKVPWGRGRLVWDIAADRWLHVRGTKFLLPLIAAPLREEVGHVTVHDLVDVVQKPTSTSRSHCHELSSGRWRCESSFPALVSPLVGIPTEPHEIAASCTIGRVAIANQIKKFRRAILQEGVFKRRLCYLFKLWCGLRQRILFRFSPWRDGSLIRCLVRSCRPR